MTETAPSIRAGTLDSVYDICVGRPWLMTRVARLVWGIEAAVLYRSIAQISSAEQITILDAPCGAGVALRALEPDQDVRYIAADRSPKMIARAQRDARRRSLEQVEFVVADITRLPLRSGEADVVVCHSGPHALADPREALAEFARCLRPGGLLTGTTFLLDDLSGRARRMFELGARRGRATPPQRDELFCWLQGNRVLGIHDRPPAGVRRVQRPQGHSRALAGLSGVRRARDRAGPSALGLGRGQLLELGQQLGQIDHTVQRVTLHRLRDAFCQLVDQGRDDAERHGQGQRTLVQAPPQRPGFGQLVQ